MTEQTQPSNPTYVVEEISEERDDRGGCRGCLWAVGGAVGCVGLIVIFMIAAILLGGGAISSLADRFSSGLTAIFGAQPTTNFSTAGLILERVQELSQLTVTRYSFSNIVSSEVEMPGVLAALYGQKLVMVAVGNIDAGVDLSVLTQEDIVLSEGVLTLTLPPVSLQNCFLNEGDSYVLSRETGVFAQPSLNLDDASRQFALHQFRDQALEKGILSDSETRAKETVERFLELFVTLSDEIRSVNIITTPADPAAEMPLSCQ